MDKPGLYITHLLRDIVNSGATVSFTEDLGHNTMTINISHPEIHNHVHVGFPGGDDKVLEKELIASLKGILETVTK